MADFDLTVTSMDLERLNNALGRYAVTSRKTMQDVLFQKGRDLSIRLFRAYRDRKWGGPQRNPGLARAELAARTAAGLGTRVRATLRKQYESERSVILIARQEAVATGNLRGHLRTIRQAVSLWQRFVGMEIRARQRGIGVLAAGWLWFRRRSSQARGVYFVQNRGGRGQIGRVDIGADYIRITNLREFAAELDARYGLSRQAINGSIADIEVYLERKASEQIRRDFAAAGLKAA